MKKAISSIVADPRVHHAVMAIAITVFAATITLLRPIDVAIWSLQAKLFSHDPSDQIVLLTDSQARANRSVETINGLVLSTLEQLEHADVEQVVVFTTLQTSADPEADAKLRDTIMRMGDQAVIAADVDEANDSGIDHVRNAPFFDFPSQTASSDLQLDFLGVVWGFEAHYGENPQHPAVWNVLAADGEANVPIYLHYAIASSRIPRVTIDEIASGDPLALAAVRGKKVVLPALGGDARRLKAPDSSDEMLMPEAVHIIAAETSLRGSGQGMGAHITVSAFGLLLLILVSVGARVSTVTRRLAYGAWCSLFLIAFVSTAYLGVRIYLADPMLMASAYALLRAVANYRRRHLYNDPRSRLPNFVAFQRDLEAMKDLANHVIVVTKIARLDAIFATLKGGEQGEYLRTIAGRLSLGENEAIVYHDGGKYFALVLRAADFPDLQGHLEGLRAIASQAVLISDRALDVAITIGVDQSSDAMPSNRISSAIAAADQAREAYRPVFIISDFETDSESWDHSLQARLESALSDNRITIKLQPKVEMQSGNFVGAEALARWTDRQRGEIRPDRFILQCERAGRLDELTKRVMQKSMNASCRLAELDLPATVSVNVSAIQFVDSRIVEIVEMSLIESRADPANMMIEITETARIENLTQARDIIEKVKALGVSFSIDDFGVGSGNLDALYELPFDELKIDRMFSNAVDRSKKARMIVESLLDLSRSLEIRSVVEGIDQMSTYDMLWEMGGDLAQGFCIARPQTLPLLTETLRLQGDGGILQRG